MRFRGRPTHRCAPIAAAGHAAGGPRRSKRTLDDAYATPGSTSDGDGGSILGRPCLTFWVADEKNKKHRKGQRPVR